MIELGFGRKCVWCNDAGGELRTITEVTPNRFGVDPREQEITVHSRHEEETRAYLQEVRDNSRMFVIFSVAWVVIGAVLALVAIYMTEGARPQDAWATMIGGPYTVALGLFVLRYPYATPDTARWLGLRDARKLARLMGVGIVAFGIGILILGL